MKNAVMGAPEIVDMFYAIESWDSVWMEIVFRADLVRRGTDVFIWKLAIFWFFVFVLFILS